MTRMRAIVAAAAAATLAGAQAVQGAAYAAGPDDEAAAAAARPAPRPEVAATPAVHAASPRVPAAEGRDGRGSTLARVPAGVLARAVLRRAQEREATAEPRERRGSRAEGEIISIEIDWHAGSATP